jgi:hypothetical protein
MRKKNGTGEPICEYRINAKAINKSLFRKFFSVKSIVKTMGICGK